MTTKKKATKKALPRLRLHPEAKVLGYYLGRSPAGVAWWYYPRAGETLKETERKLKAQAAGLAALKRAHGTRKAKATRKRAR